MKRLAVLLVMLFAFARLAFGAVNINTATADELDKLKGIGPAKAQAIIDHRKKNGPFKAIEDLKNVTGIGESTFEAIKGELTISGRPGKPAAAKPAAAAANPAPAAANPAPAVAKPAPAVAKPAPAADKSTTREPAPVAKGDDKKGDAKKEAPKN